MISIKASCFLNFAYKYTIMMNRNQRFLKLLIISCCLMCSLNKAQPEEPVYPMGPIPTNPFTQQAQNIQQTAELKSPLLRSIVSRLDTKESNPAVQQSQQVKATNFFSTFVQNLEARRPQKQNSFDPTNRFEITIRDGSSTAVNIDFFPTAFDNTRWNSIVDLLADSLAFVIQEAEKQGFSPKFKYSVSLEEAFGGVSAFGGLSPTALKSAVG